jgi:hypothetical protein
MPYLFNRIVLSNQVQIISTTITHEKENCRGCSRTPQEIEFLLNSNPSIVMCLFCPTCFYNLFEIRKTKSIVKQENPWKSMFLFQPCVSRNHTSHLSLKQNFEEDLFQFKAASVIEVSSDDSFHFSKTNFGTNVPDNNFVGYFFMDFTVVFMDLWKQEELMILSLGSEKEKRDGLTRPFMLAVWMGSVDYCLDQMFEKSRERNINTNHIVEKLSPPNYKHIQLAKRMEIFSQAKTLCSQLLNDLQKNEQHHVFQMPLPRQSSRTPFKSFAQSAVFNNNNNINHTNSNHFSPMLPNYAQSSMRSFSLQFSNSYQPQQSMININSFQQPQQSLWNPQVSQFFGYNNNNSMYFPNNCNNNNTDVSVKETALNAVAKAVEAAQANSNWQAPTIKYEIPEIPSYNTIKYENEEEDNAMNTDESDNNNSNNNSVRHRSRSKVKKEYKRRHQVTKPKPRIEESKIHIYDPMTDSKKVKDNKQVKDPKVRAQSIAKSRCSSAGAAETATNGLLSSLSLMTIDIEWGGVTYKVPIHPPTVPIAISASK